MFIFYNQPNFWLIIIDNEFWIWNLNEIDVNFIIFWRNDLKKGFKIIWNKKYLYKRRIFKWKNFKILIFIIHTDLKYMLLSFCKEWNSLFIDYLICIKSLIKIKILINESILWPSDSSLSKTVSYIRLVWFCAEIIDNVDLMEKILQFKLNWW